MMHRKVLPIPVRRFVERLRTESQWSLTPDELDEDDELARLTSTWAGRQGDVAWWSNGNFATPAVVVRGTDAVLELVWAQEPLVWSHSYNKLDRLLAGRMVRFPVEHLEGHFPDRLPVGRLVYELPDEWTQTSAGAWLAGGAQWRLVEDRLLHVDDWFGGPTTIRAGEVAEVPVSPRLVDEAVDAADVAPGWADARLPGPLADRLLLQDEHEDGRPYWLLRDTGLADALGVHNALKAERLVERELRKRAPELAGRIEFDSEAAEFFASAPEESDVQRLGALLDQLITERR